MRTPDVKSTRWLLIKEKGIISWWVVTVGMGFGITDFFVLTDRSKEGILELAYLLV